MEMWWQVLDVPPKRTGSRGSSVVNFDFQHRVVCKQFFRGFLGSTLFRELRFEMSIDDQCVAIRRRNISPLVFLGCCSSMRRVGFFMSAISAPFHNCQVIAGIECLQRMNRHKPIAR